MLKTPEFPDHNRSSSIEHQIRKLKDYELKIIRIVFILDNLNISVFREIQIKAIFSFLNSEGAELDAILKSIHQADNLKKRENELGILYYPDLKNIIILFNIGLDNIPDISSEIMIRAIIEWEKNLSVSAKKDAIRKLISHFAR